MAALMDARITEKRAQEVAPGEMAMRRVAEQLPCVVWTAGPDGIPTWFNRHYNEFTGMADRNYRELIHPDDLAAHDERWAESRRLNRVHVGRSRIRGADGEYHLMVTKANPMRDPTGEVMYWVGCTTIVAPLSLLEVRAA